MRSDLHGYNLKQKMRGRPPVSEVEFESLVAQLDESISGSDSTDSDDSDDGGGKPKETTLSALLKKQANIADGDAADAPSHKKRNGPGKAPIIWFASSKVPENVRLGIYRAVFQNAEQQLEGKLVEALRRKQLAARSGPPPSRSTTKEDDEGGVPLPVSTALKNVPDRGPHYFLCMIGGGHFAAMLVSLVPRLTKKSGVEDRTAEVIAHKTFHRYTTRRKQGGSQSANDNAKGNAHSAGSSIRRYNEAALTHEVRALLQDWKDLIEASELIFIRATGSTNRRTLFGPYEGSFLSPKDDRLRGFPFSTRRATQSELMRAFVELTRVRISMIDEAALTRQAEKAEAQAAAAEERSQAAGRPGISKVPKLSKEEEEAAVHTTQIQALIRRSKVPALLSYIQSSSLSPDFTLFPADQNRHAPTPLHFAATSGRAACVTSLLFKVGADPTIKNQEGKSAFEISSDRSTRDAFRLARKQLGEDRWNWDGAGVPSGLSQDEIDSRSAMEKAERQAEAHAENERRAAEVEKLRKMDEQKVQQEKEGRFGKGHLLDRPRMTAEERRAEESKGMSEETKKKLEREKRARAAEERMKRLTGGK